MENASKALLIAAALLIVILLITFGIKIFSSSSNSADNAASVVGKEIELATSDASDIIAGYSVKKFDNQYVEIKNYYYKEFNTGIEINENTTYIISFDYIIEEKGEYDINCGIGMEINNSNDYDADFIYQKAYPSQEVGKKNTFTFTLKPNDYTTYIDNKDKKIYLSLRLARTSEKSTFKVKIENIKIKYKVD